MKQSYGNVTGSLLMFFLVSVFLPAVYAQDEADNLAKYWQYRNAYKHQFVVVGENQGQSIPFATVHPNEDISWEGLWNHHLECYPRPSGKGGLTTGDATLQLGIYMGILATEYALLKREGISTDHIAEELYYAIKAYERLDAGAEPFFGNPGPNDPTFFLRDDIPADFMKNEEGEFYIRNYFAQDTNDSLIKVTQGDYSCANLSSEQKFPGVTSQDQVAHLSVGFTLIQKYVDDDLQYNGTGIKQYGRTVYRSLFDGYKQNNYVAGKPMQVDPLWRFDYRSLIQAAYPFRRTINIFYGGNELNTTQDKNLWQNLFLPGYLVSDKPYNHAMGLIWAALGDAANNDVWMSRQGRDRHLELYALLHACLHDREVGNLLSQDDFKRLLDVAPCNLPCGNPLSGCPTPDNLDWNVGYRWTNNSRNSDQGWQRGFFNGADYMLLYNLYYLKYEPNIAFYPPPPAPCDFYAAVPFDSLAPAVPTGMGRPDISPGRINLYPNPASESVTLLLPVPSGYSGASYTISLFTADGREVHRWVIDGNKQQTELNLKGLPPQLYVLRLLTNDAVYTGMVVKQ